MLENQRNNCDTNYKTLMIFRWLYESCRRRQLAYVRMSDTDIDMDYGVSRVYSLVRLRSCLSRIFALTASANSLASSTLVKLTPAEQVCKGGANNAREAASIVTVTVNGAVLLDNIISGVYHGRDCPTLLYNFYYVIRHAKGYNSTVTIAFGLLASFRLCSGSFLLSSTCSFGLFTIAFGLFTIYCTLIILHY